MLLHHAIIFLHLRSIFYYTFNIRNINSILFWVLFRVYFLSLFFDRIHGFKQTTDCSSFLRKYTFRSWFKLSHLLVFQYSVLACHIPQLVIDEESRTWVASQDEFHDMLPLMLGSFYQDSVDRGWSFHGSHRAESVVSRTFLILL